MIKLKVNNIEYEIFQFLKTAEVQYPFFVNVYRCTVYSSSSSRVYLVRELCSVYWVSSVITFFLPSYMNKEKNKITAKSVNVKNVNLKAEI